MDKWKIIFKLNVVLFCLMFTFAGCGGGGGSGSSDSSGASKVSTKSGKSTKQIPIATFTGSVDIASGTITFKVDDNPRTRRRNARQYSENGAVPHVAVASTGASWDGINKILSGNVTITNYTSDTLYAAYAVIENISEPDVSVYNEYGYEPSGFAYFDHAPGGEKIAPGATGSPIQWQFSDPNSTSFNFRGSIYADNWHQIAGPGASTGFNWDSNGEDNTDNADNIFFPSLASFNGKIYAVLGKNDHADRNENSNTRKGAEHWEYDPTSGAFRQINSDGWGGSEAAYNKIFNNMGGQQFVYDSKLYVGTGKSNNAAGLETPINNGGEIWRYNGSSWTSVFQDTDSDGINNLFEFDGSLFAGSLESGAGRTYAGSKADGNLAYSITGDSGSWSWVMTDAFGDTGINDASAVSKPVGSTILDGGSLSIGSATHGFVGKAGDAVKPGLTLYIADTKVGGGGGRLESDWVLAAGSVDTTAFGDDTLRNVTTVSAFGDNCYKIRGSGTAFLPHQYAHKYMQIKHGSAIYTNVSIIDSNSSNDLVTVFHGGPAFTPSTSDQVYLGSGANERGLGESGNSTAMFSVFSPSIEGLAGSGQQLWVFAANKVSGVAQYPGEGGEILSLINISNDKGVANKTGDTDWVRRMDSFTYNQAGGAGTSFPIPSTAGGLNRGGTVLLPNPSYAGFDTGIDPANPLDVNGKDELTLFPGQHNGWLYVAAAPSGRVNTGCRIYRTADGVNWMTVTTDGFGDNNLSVRTFVSSGGKLYAGGSRMTFSDAVESRPTQKVGIGTSDTAFYDTPVTTTFTVPSVVFPQSGTLLLEANTHSNPVNAGDIYYEKVSYTNNRVTGTGATLGASLPANNGYLGKTLFANASNLVLSDEPANLGLDPISGAIVMDGELIEYTMSSGSTLTPLIRAKAGSSPDWVSGINHNIGTPVYRTTRPAALADGSSGVTYSIVLTGDTSQFSLSKTTGPNVILIGDEEIMYDSIVNGTELRTPLRGYNKTSSASHSSGDNIDKPGFSGLSRGALGTTASNWGVGENVTSISLPPAELWVTD